MCGIVGLLVKNQKMRANIGELMLPMLIGMTERGPDSAGLAIFGTPVGDDERKFSLYTSETDFNWQKLAHDFLTHLGSKVVSFNQKVNHAVLTTHLEPETVKIWLHEHYPDIHLLAIGQLMDIYKDVGTPAEVAAP